MDWFWKNLFSGLTLEVLLVLGGGTALAFAKKKLPEFAPILAYGVLGVIGMSILIFTFTGRAIFAKNPPPSITEDNVDDYVRLWAEHLGMSIGPQTESDAYFAHKLSLPPGNDPVIVFRGKEKPGYLQFKGIINVADEHQAVLAKMPQAKVNQIVQQLNGYSARQLGLRICSCVGN